MIDINSNQKDTSALSAKQTVKFNSAQLRAYAEKKVNAMSTEDVEALSPQKMQQMLYEQQVHQIELEMQNEELLRIQAELDASRARYFDLYDLAPVGYCTISSKNNLILEANLAAANLLGVTRGLLFKQPITRFILKEDQDIFYLHRKQLLKTFESQTCELRMMKNDGTTFWTQMEAIDVKPRPGDSGQNTDDEILCRVVMSDITSRKKADKEKEKLISQLKDALLKIKKLSGLLPICASCKNIRDDKGYWKQIEAYITENSEAEFSHSLCPECAKKIYPQLFEKDIEL